MPTATGLDFEPLDDGTILIEFYGDDGVTITSQVITLEVFDNIPVVVALTKVALSKGSPLAREIAKKLSERNAS